MSLKAPFGVLSRNPWNWTFMRLGGLVQARLRKAEDFRHLDELDPKLWVALCCPVKGLEFDTKTLEMIDTDKDGRIRVPEILAAVKWAASLLKDPSDLTKGAEELPLTSINDQTAEGARILASAKEILKSLGKPDDVAVSSAETSDVIRIFSQTRFNGDGIIIPDCASDDEVRKVISETAQCCGSQKDRSGKDGVDKATVDRFYQALADYSAWQAKAESGAQSPGSFLPLGESTAAACAAFQAVRTKIQDYFSRCRLAAFDPRAAVPLNRAEAELAALAGKDLSVLGDDVAALPLARVDGGRALPLVDGLNPAWTARMEQFVHLVAAPLLGKARTSMTEAEWRQIQERLAPYEGWIASKAGAEVEPLGIARVREILAGKAREAIDSLFATEADAAPRMDAMEHVDRLVRYHRDLFTLLNNFVSFKDFYSPDKWGIFQAGTLYLDGRSCELCIRVDDIAKHSAVATLGKMYLAYCECSRKDMPAKINIAVAFTAGDSDYLMVGRNGLFIDRQGRDWDATIVKVIENPISIRQAFWAPYKRAARMISEQVEKFAASKEKAMQDKTAAGVEAAAKKATEGKPAAAPAAPGAPAPAPAPTPFDIGKTVGIFAAIGLAAGALGTALAAIVKAFLGLAWWQMPLAILAVMILISGPSVLLAWLKLRQRTMGPLLDGAGWAINGRIMINFLLGRALTAMAVLPPNSIRSFEDPFEPPDNTRRRNILIFILIVVAIAAAIFHWYWWR